MNWVGVKMRMLATVLLWLMLPGLNAQTASTGTPKFEVASVKPERPVSQRRRPRSRQTAPGLRNHRQPHSLGLPRISDGPSKCSRVPQRDSNTDLGRAIVAEF